MFAPSGRSIFNVTAWQLGQEDRASSINLARFPQLASVLPVHASTSEDNTGIEAIMDRTDGGEAVRDRYARSDAGRTVSAIASR